MKRLMTSIFTIILCVTIILIAIAIYDIYFKNNNDVNQLSTIKNIAINNAYVNEVIKKYNGSYIIENITMSDSTRMSGYLNYSHKLANVDIHFGDYGLFGENLNLTVDIDNKEVLSIYHYELRATPASVYAKLPYGTCWYQEVLDLSVRVNVIPNDSVLYPIILNESNLILLKNGQCYQALRYMDYYTNNKTIFNGTVPINSGWRTSLATQSGDPYTLLRDEHPYIVFYNNLKKNMTVHLDF